MAVLYGPMQTPFNIDISFRSICVAAGVPPVGVDGGVPRRRHHAPRHLPVRRVLRSGRGTQYRIQ